MSERRYSDEQAAEIFAKATETQESGQRRVGGGQGMTLAELQDIGREAGITPEAIAQAAALVDHNPAPTSRQFLGLTIGVGRSIDLGRPLTEPEWERLVVDLRDTFDARGRVSAHGSFRQWTNGNLQALLEPTETGHRLRIRTMKGNSRSAMMVGVGMVGVAAASALSAVVGGTLGAAEAISTVGSLGVVGLGFFGLGAAQLPSWARTRAQQMDEVIARLARSVGEKSLQRATPEGSEPA